jgi:hypothetical protein
MIECGSEGALEPGYIAIVRIALCLMIRSIISVTPPPISSIAFGRKEGINHITTTMSFLTRIPELDIHSISLRIQDLFLYNHFSLIPSAMRDQLCNLPVIGTCTDYNGIVVGIVFVGLRHHTGDLLLFATDLTVLVGLVFDDFIITSSGLS